MPRFNVRAYVPGHRSITKGSTEKNHIVEEAVDEADAIEKFKEWLSPDLRNSPDVERYSYEVTPA